MDNRSLSKRYINGYTKWFINGYPNSLSATNPCELLTTFQADDQHIFKWIISHHQVDNRPLSKRYINGYTKRFINGYANRLSATIQVDN